MEPRDGPTSPGLTRRYARNFPFLISVALWRPYSKLHGRLDENNFPATLARAGFHHTGTELALGGLGIIGCGEK